MYVYIHLSFSLSHYIYIYTFTRFAYSTVRHRWSRTKHRSKQCSVCEGKMSQSELSTGDSNAWVEAAQGLRRKDKYVRAVTSSEQWHRKRAWAVLWSAQFFQKHAWAVISKTKCLQSMLEQWFRIFSGFRKWQNSDSQCFVRQYCVSERTFMHLYIISKGRQILWEFHLIFRESHSSCSVIKCKS